MTLIVATALCLIGAAAVVAGAALLSPPAALIVAGALTLAFGSRAGYVASGGRK